MTKTSLTFQTKLVWTMGVTLAIDNESHPLSEQKGDLAEFLTWLRENGDSSFLKNLHLVSRINENAFMEWHKKEINQFDQISNGDYYAVVKKELASQSFGRSQLPGDFGSFVQSHGVAGGGEYYSKLFNKRVQGTSFVAPAQGGAMAQALYHLIVKEKMSWKQALEKAGVLFEQSLRKEELHMVWEEVDSSLWDEGPFTVSWKIGSRLNPGEVGRGVFDYQNFLSLVLTGKSAERSFKASEKSDLLFLLQEEDLNGIVTKDNFSTPLLGAPLKEASQLFEKHQIKKTLVEGKGMVKTQLPESFFATGSVQTNKSSYPKLSYSEYQALGSEQFEGYLNNLLSLQCPSQILCEITDVPDLETSLELFLKYKSQERRVRITHSLKDVTQLNSVLRTLLKIKEPGFRISHPFFGKGELSYGAYRSLNPDLLKEYLNWKGQQITIVDIPNRNILASLSSQAGTLPIAGFMLSKRAGMNLSGLKVSQHKAKQPTCCGRL